MTFTNDQFRLDGKVAIVTGAGGRGNSIGRAYAFGLSNAGASVVVADLNGEGAQKVADEINAAGAAWASRFTAACPSRPSLGWAGRCWSRI